MDFKQFLSNKKEIDIRQLKANIKAGIIDFDSFLMSMQARSRVEGNYVILSFRNTKDNSTFEMRLRLNTFKQIVKRVANLAQAVDMDLKS